MSEPRQRRPRRRARRRSASTSSSAGAAPPTGEVFSRQLAALAATADVALCRLHYYLDRTALYQADLEAHHPFPDYQISCIGTSFQTDMTNYVLAMQRDISRLEGAQKAMKAAVRAGPAGTMARAANSAPALGRQQSSSRLSSSSSETDGARGTNPTVPQRRQRQKGRQTASALQLHRLRAPGNTTESGGEREESSASSGAGDEYETCQSGPSAGDLREAVASTSRGAGGEVSASGGTGAGDESQVRSSGGGGGGGAGAGGGGGGSQGRSCPPGGTGSLGKDAHPTDDIRTSDEKATAPYGTGADTEHKTKVGLSDNKGDGRKLDSDLPVGTAEDNAEAQPSTSTSFGEVQVRATGDASDKERRPSAAVSGKSSGATKSSTSSTRSTLDSATNGARRADRDWAAERTTASGSASLEASPQSLAPPVAAIDGSSSVRNVLHELYRQYGLLRRLLAVHLRRLLRRTCAAGRRAAEAEGQQVSAQVVLSRAAAAAGAELLRMRAQLGERALHVRGFCEAARRLQACRPQRPPRPPPRSRRFAAAITMAPPSPPSPPPQQRQSGGAFSMEGLLSLCLCWRRPHSD